MPAYGSIGPTALQPGDQFTLFNAETLTPPASSVAIARGYAPQGGDSPAITFTISFAAAPTDSLVIMGSNVDVLNQYQVLYTSTNKQLDFYTDTNRFAFYLAKLVSQTGGGAVTVIAQR